MNTTEGKEAPDSISWDEGYDLSRVKEICGSLVYAVRILLKMQEAKGNIAPVRLDKACEVRVRDLKHAIELLEGVRAKRRKIAETP